MGKKNKGRKSTTPSESHSNRESVITCWLLPAFGLLDRKSIRRAPDNPRQTKLATVTIQRHLPGVKWCNPFLVSLDGRCIHLAVKSYNEREHVRRLDDGLHWRAPAAVNCVYSQRRGQGEWAPRIVCSCAPSIPPADWLYPTDARYWLQILVH